MKALWRWICFDSLALQLAYPVIYNVGDMLDGHTQVQVLADSTDHITPGHDLTVLDQCPRLIAALAGWIVRLDLPPVTTNRK